MSKPEFAPVNISKEQLAKVEQLRDKTLESIDLLDEIMGGMEDDSVKAQLAAAGDDFQTVIETLACARTHFQRILDGEVPWDEPEEAQS